jgi:hypothetical protein
MCFEAVISFQRLTTADATLMDLSAHLNLLRTRIIGRCTILHGKNLIAITLMLIFDMASKYLISRFSEQDLLMREHWGLDVGHYLAHGCLPLYTSLNLKLSNEKSELTGAIDSTAATVYPQNASLESNSLCIQHTTPQHAAPPGSKHHNTQGLVGVEDDEDHNDNLEYAMYDLGAEADKCIDEDSKGDRVEVFGKDLKNIDSNNGS